MIRNSEHANDDDEDYDEDQDDKPNKGIPVSTNELTDITIERPEFVVTESTVVELVGTIFSVIDKTVVVQSHTTPFVLDMESLLVMEDGRTILGEVFETFGPVDRPFYSVRFNTVDEIPQNAVKGAKVSYVPGYERTRLVQVEKLKLIKGTDASNRYDEEAGDDEIEFSDDEQEMAYKQYKKKKGKQQKMNGKNNNNNAVDDGRRLQSYADIMGPTPKQQQRQQQSSRHPDTMSDLLNSYMTSRPHTSTVQPVKSSFAISTAPPAQPVIVPAQPVITPAQPVVTQQPVHTPEHQHVNAPEQQHVNALEQPPVNAPEQPPTSTPEQPTSTPTAPNQPSFFQSIRSIFSRAPPS
ncbi:Gar1/Naf1 RNA binding region-domain-containing protein [Chlamydoabsidia padenii]|nr:Gar1/Naf1 RNA binding region-domain-containing protein [Chlamydoabsidia padenii]